MEEIVENRQITQQLDKIVDLLQGVSEEERSNCIKYFKSKIDSLEEILLTEGCINWLKDFSVEKDMDGTCELQYVSEVDSLKIELKISKK